MTPQAMYISATLVAAFNALHLVHVMLAFLPFARVGVFFFQCLIMSRFAEKQLAGEEYPAV